jgi:hypothetical protein
MNAWGTISGVVLRDDIALSVEEAYRRLADLQAGLAFLIRFLMTAVPEDFLSRES